MKLNWLRVLLAGLLAVVLLGACGDSDDKEGADSGDPSGEAAEASKVSVKTAEYAFQFASTNMKGGLVELTLDNTAGKESHEADLVRLDSGKTLADYKAVPEDGPPPAWVHLQGGPGPVEAGKTAVYTGNLAPGTYVVQCHVPAPDGKSHADKGMQTEITVSEGEAGDIPEGDATVEAKEYDFVGFDKLKAGEQTVRVENTGKEPHHWALVALAPGKTAADLGAFFASQGPPSGPPPFTGFPGLVSSLPPGGEAVRTLNLKSGTSYALVCFIPAPDGQPHAAKGMLKEFKIS